MWIEYEVEHDEGDSGGGWVEGLWCVDGLEFDVGFGGHGRDVLAFFVRMLVFVHEVFMLDGVPCKAQEPEGVHQRLHRVICNRLRPLFRKPKEPTVPKDTPTQVPHKTLPSILRRRRHPSTTKQTILTPLRL